MDPILDHLNSLFYPLFCLHLRIVFALELKMNRGKLHDRKRAPFSIVLAFLAGSALGAFILSALIRPQRDSELLLNEYHSLPPLQTPVASTQTPKTTSSPFFRSGTQAGTSALQQNGQAQKNRISAIQAQLNDLAFEETAKLTSTLSQLLNEKRVQQENIATLEAQIRNLESSLPQEQKNAEIQLAGENLIVGQLLNDLQQRINTQKHFIQALQRQQIALVAPPESDATVQIRNELTKAQSTLAQLETHYSNIIQTREAKLAEKNDYWYTRLYSQQAGQIDLQVSIDTARSDLDGILNQINHVNQAKIKITEKQLELKNELTKLQSELNSLQSSREEEETSNT